MRKRSIFEQKNIKLRPEDLMRPDIELIRLTDSSLDIVNSNFLQRKLLDLTVENVCLHDLIRQLDPDHMYLYSAEYQAFVKTPISKREKVDGDKTGVRDPILDGAIITNPEDIQTQM